MSKIASLPGVSRLRGAGEGSERSDLVKHSLEVFFADRAKEFPGVPGPWAAAELSP